MDTNVKRICLTVPILIPILIPIHSKYELDNKIEENTSKKMIILTNDNQTKNIQTNKNQTNKNQTKNILTNEYQTKNIQKKEKEKKMRVETNTWGLNQEDLSFETQLGLLRQIYEGFKETNIDTNTNTNKDKQCENNKDKQMLISHIKTKISSYKQQDILKNKLNINLHVYSIKYI